MERMNVSIEYDNELEVISLAVYDGCVIKAEYNIRAREVETIENILEALGIECNEQLGDLISESKMMMQQYKRDRLYQLGYEAGVQAVEDKIEKHCELGKPVLCNDELYFFKNSKENLVDIMDDLEASYEEENKENEHQEAEKEVSNFKCGNCEMRACLERLLEIQKNGMWDFHIQVGRAQMINEIMASVEENKSIEIKGQMWKVVPYAEEGKEKSTERKQYIVPIKRIKDGAEDKIGINITACNSHMAELAVVGMLISDGAYEGGIGGWYIDHEKEIREV